MLTKIALGAELDIASSKELSEGVDRVLDTFNGKKKPKPTLLRKVFAQSIAPPFTGILDTKLSPPFGRVWNILTYATCGETEHVQATTGIASLFIGAASLRDTANLGDLIIPRSTVPSWESFNERTVWCQPSEVLYWRLEALATVTQFMSVFTIAEWRQDDVLEHIGR